MLQRLRQCRPAACAADFDTLRVGRLPAQGRKIDRGDDLIGLATLLLDLLAPEEERDRRNVFDIGLLASRLGLATRWVRDTPGTSRLGIGYFGASTGAAAALRAAAEAGPGIAAVVSRGGRPDLAMDVLDRVRAPTLLVVGSLDGPVIELNRQAHARLACEKRLVVVPGAGHLFEEPGTLDEVVRLATEWFATFLAGDSPDSPLASGRNSRR